MRLCWIICILLFCVFSCSSNKKIFLEEGVEYWGPHYAGDTSTLMQEYQVFIIEKDTVSYITNYYANGALKSRITMKNDLLWDIDFVLDTLGNTLDFGEFEKGNGKVIQFCNKYSYKKYEGDYLNGNREGWWLIYHHHGYIMDSIFYSEGYHQHENSKDNGIGELIYLQFGSLKNNFYD